MQYPPRLTFPLWLALCATPAAAQELHASFRQPGLDYVRLIPFEDRDGDGIQDVLIATQFNDAGGNDWGLVLTLSGATAAVLEEYPAPRPGIYWGSSVVATGDLDGDGVGDLAIGAEWDTQVPGQYAGSLTVLSGASGADLYKVWGRPYWSFASATVRLGDLDGDGAGDLAVGAFYGNTIRLLSGASGKLLLEIHGEAAAGDALAAPGDLNGNGSPDLVFSDPGDVSHPWVRWTRAVDGASGAILWQNDLVAGAVEALDDLDGDGIQEVAVDYQYFSVDGAAVLSGATGAQLYLLQDVETSSLAVLDDQDGDGIREVIAWERHHVSGVEGDFRVHSGATGQKLYTFQLPKVTGFVEVHRLGDLDGDGAPDLGFTDNGWLDTPEVRLVRGPGPTGSPICAESAAPNSTGVRARLAAEGSDVVGGYPLAFVATDLPRGSAAILHVSRALAGPPFAWNALCLGSPAGSFFGTAGNADAAGRIEFPWDKEFVPVPLGTGSFTAPGQTWHFQVLYVDAVSGSTRTTPALTVELR